LPIGGNKMLKCIYTKNPEIQKRLEQHGKILTTNLRFRRLEINPQNADFSQ
jgi:hypothetical protein